MWRKERRACFAASNSGTDKVKVCWKSTRSPHKPKADITRKFAESYAQTIHLFGLLIIITLMIKIIKHLNPPFSPHFKNSVCLLCSPLVPLSIAPFWLVALQPLTQCVSKVLPGNCTSCKVGSEVVAVLRIWHCVSKDVPLACLNTALGCIGECIDLGRERFGTERGKRSPRVELAARPVYVRGANVPATEDAVGTVCVRPLREQ